MIPVIILVVFKIYLDVLAHQIHHARVNNRAPVLIDVTIDRSVS
jgi:hypothetical protein